MRAHSEWDPDAQENIPGPELEAHERSELAETLLTGPHRGPSLKPLVSTFAGLEERLRREPWTPTPPTPEERAADRVAHYLSTPSWGRSPYLGTQAAEIVAMVKAELEEPA